MTAYTVATRILRRLQSSSGSVWSAKDLLDLGSRAAVDQALHRLSRDGRIRRVARGLYDYPRKGALAGQRSPDPLAVAKAAARARGASARVTGAAAANAFGLTTQVPASAVYLTDGPARSIDLGRRRVRLAKVSGKRVALAGGAGMLIEALRYLGKDAASALSAADVRRVASVLKPTDIQHLQKSAHVAPDWMRPVIARVTALGIAPSSPDTP